MMRDDGGVDRRQAIASSSTLVGITSLVAPSLSLVALPQKVLSAPKHTVDFAAFDRNPFNLPPAVLQVSTTTTTITTTTTTAAATVKTMKRRIPPHSREERAPLTDMLPLYYYYYYHYYSTLIG